MTICFVLFSRIIDQRFEKVSYFVFGDFNFRLDAKAVVEVGRLFPARVPCQCLFFKYFSCGEAESDLMN